MLIEKHLENGDSIGQLLWCTQIYPSDSCCYAAVAHGQCKQILLALNVFILLFKNISVKHFVQNNGEKMVSITPFPLSWGKKSFFQV